MDTSKVEIPRDLDDLPHDELGLHALRFYLAEIDADEATRTRLFGIWDTWRRSLKHKGPRVARRRKLDEQIQAILGVSRRTLLRHRAVQSLDTSVKDLLSNLKLPNSVLEKISHLRPLQRRNLLTELQDATDAREVLARHFTDRTRRHKKTANALAAFVRNLKWGRADLEGREPEIGRLPVEYETELRESRALIDRVLGFGSGQMEGSV